MSLLFSHDGISSQFVSHSIEVGDHDSHKQIYDQKVPNDDEEYEVEDPTLLMVDFWLEINLSGINSQIRYLKPPFSRNQLEKSEDCLGSVIEVCIWIDPGASHIKAVELGFYEVQSSLFSYSWKKVHIAAKELSFKEVYPHNGKY